MGRVTFTCLWALIFFQTGLTQHAAELKKKSEAFLLAGQYQSALETLLRYTELRPNDGDALAETGICYFHLNRAEEAGKYLRASLDSSESPPSLTYFYLGKLHQAGLDFETGAGFYKTFLKKTDKNHPFRASVKDDIRRCAVGIRVRRQAPYAAVINLGELVNSIGDEFRPLLAPADKGRLYFTGQRPPFSRGSDIFLSELENGDWSQPQSFSRIVNSEKNEVALDFDQNGDRLFLFRGETTGQGIILVDNLHQKLQEQRPFFEKFTGPLDPARGDTGLFFFNDSTVLFASKRSGGFGGLDLYVSYLLKGRWTEPENLGPVINSPYDETSPFLAADGRTLFFSTNDAERSAGGFDILKTVFLDQTGRWSPPQNLGFPLNSAADDLDIRLTADGSGAFFASSRMDGFGGLDLYVAFFDKPETCQTTTSRPAGFHLVPARRAFGN